MTSEQKRKRKEEQVAGALLNTALDRLNELSAPYCLLMGERIMSNQTEVVARAMVCDMANLLTLIQEKRNELQADRIVYGITGSDDGDTKQA